MTLRDLCIMAEAKQRERWNHTATLLATMINLTRNPKKSQPAKPEDFNPFIKKEPPPKLKGNDLKILKDIFVKRKK